MSSSNFTVKQVFETLNAKIEEHKAALSHMTPVSLIIDIYGLPDKFIDLDSFSMKLHALRDGRIGNNLQSIPQREEEYTKAFDATMKEHGMPNDWLLHDEEDGWRSRAQMLVERELAAPKTDPTGEGTSKIATPEADQATATQEEDQAMATKKEDQASATQKEDPKKATQKREPVFSGTNLHVYTWFFPNGFSGAWRDLDKVNRKDLKFWASERQAGLG